MVDIIEVETERLKLRQWKMEDRQFFANINADHEGMNFYLSVLNTKESNDIAQKFELLIAERGWGFWAVEKIDEKNLLDLQDFMNRLMIYRLCLTLKLIGDRARNIGGTDMQLKQRKYPYK